MLCSAGHDRVTAARLWQTGILVNQSKTLGSTQQHTYKSVVSAGTNLAMELRHPVALSLVETHGGPHAVVTTVITACPS